MLLFWVLLLSCPMFHSSFWIFNYRQHSQVPFTRNHTSWQLPTSRQVRTIIVTYSLSVPQTVCLAGFPFVFFNSYFHAVAMSFAVSGAKIFIFAAPALVLCTAAHYFRCAWLCVWARIYFTCCTLAKANSFAAVLFREGRATVAECGTQKKRNW